MFNFELSADDIKRNTELLIPNPKYNKIVLGGIVLAIKDVNLRQTRVEFKNKSWFTKKDAGIPVETNRETVVNSDGTRTVIVENRTTQADGTITTTREETTFASTARSTVETEEISIPLADPSTQLGDGSPSMWTDKVVNKKTRIVKVPRGSTVEYITDIVEEQPENPRETYKKINRTVNQHKPVPPAKPVTVTTVTGAIFDQFIGPPPPQGQDPYWWSEEMVDSSEEELVSEVDNEDGTKTTTTTKVSTDPDGNMREEITVETATIEPENDDRLETSKTVTTPSSVEKTVTLYDTAGNIKNRVKTLTVKYDPFEGETQEQVTEVTETSTDEFGKVVEKFSKTILNPQTGVEDTEEKETIINPGDSQKTYNRSISKDLLTGVETISETLTTTDGYGNSTTETRESKRTGTVRSVSSQSVKQDTVDLIIDDIIDAYVVTEYEFSGELMSMPQVFKIKNKYDQHQLAWGFLQLREQQLDLGDRLSPEMRSQLWREWQSVFLGEPSETMKGGPVLDRIEAYIFGEKSVPVVFAPDPSSFDVNWIPGAFGLFSWSMRLQVYNKLVRSKDGSFRQESAGGVYGRVNADHWVGGSVNELFDEDKLRFKSQSEGGQWLYQ